VPGARCRYAYGPADAIAISLSLASFAYKTKKVLSVVSADPGCPEKRPLKECSQYAVDCGAVSAIYLRHFDAIGCEAGRANSLYKTEW